MQATVLILPLAVSIALAIWLRFAGRDWRSAIAQGLALGFTLPLAIAYCFVLNWPDWSGDFFQETAARIGIALVVMPQVYVLAPAGILWWRRFIKSGAKDAGIGLAMALPIVVIALLGHLWTWTILGAGPVVG